MAAEGGATVPVPYAVRELGRARECLEVRSMSNQAVLTIMPRPRARTMPIAPKKAPAHMCITHTRMQNAAQAPRDTRQTVRTDGAAAADAMGQRVDDRDICGGRHDRRRRRTGRQAPPARTDNVDENGAQNPQRCDTPRPARRVLALASASKAARCCVW
jgi:hypothetical protein